MGVGAGAGVGAAGVGALGHGRVEYCGQANGERQVNMYEQVGSCFTAWGTESAAADLSQIRSKVTERA